MYSDFFKLSELPFSLTPNTLYYQPLASHQEALNLVLVALSSGDGFVKITGEVGLGKTMLCRMLLNELDDQGHISVYLPNSFLSPSEFRASFARELGVYPEGKSHEDLLQAVSDRLVHYAQVGQSVVLLVDEAQAMPRETIEALRLLTNLETESRKLFQVVLIGQPELDEQLDQASLRQLKQRITFSCELQPLSADEVAEYLGARSRSAGYTGEPLFSLAAVKALHQSSKGVPRLLNILGHKALLSAYGKGSTRVEADHVKAAIDDSSSQLSSTLASTAAPDNRFWHGLVVGFVLAFVSMLIVEQVLL
ncbi:MAG: ExeA family protein [Pontibacterium sp.]